jgi:hypothetical protein
MLTRIRLKLSGNSGAQQQEDDDEKIELSKLELEGLGTTDDLRDD